MAHKSWTLAVVLSFLSIVPQSISNPIQYPGTSGYTVLGGGSSTSSTPAEVDPEDFSAIKNVATIGDSYAAGIGAGSRRDFSCSRYDHSYPYLLASYEGLENATFQFLACSGALSTDVLAKQVPKINGIVDVITISAGGNDVGLTDILNDCIFGWKFFGYSSSGCDKTLANSQNLINTELPGALDNLFNAAKLKLTPTTGRIYVTAYAQFFGSSSQCDSVYWNFYPKDLYAQALTSARRTTMNTLASDVNSAIQAAVARAGSQVVFVDYDGYYTDFNGRFCEEGVTEPAPERDDLLFFERYTTNPSLDWKEKRQTSGAAPNAEGGIPPASGPASFRTMSPGPGPTSALANVPQSTDTAVAPLASHFASGGSTNTTRPVVSLAAALADPDNIVPNGTFEGTIAAMIASTLAEDPSLVSALNGSIFEQIEAGPAPADGSVPQLISAVFPSNDVASARRRLGRRDATDWVVWLIADDVKRVFHPRPKGHALMASLVLYHMEAQNAIMNPAPEYANNATLVWTELGSALSCPIQAPDIPYSQIGGRSITGGSVMI